MSKAYDEEKAYFRRRVRIFGRVWIAFDPGDRWTGVAVLALNDFLGAYAEAFVLDAEASDWVEPVRYLKRLLALADPKLVTVLAEDYRTRPQGHQAFSRGTTLRLLGALESAAEIAGCAWGTIAPGSPDDLKLLKLGTLFSAWEKEWPRPGDSDWRHARSAWRVLGQHLAFRESATFAKLRRAKLRPARATYVEVETGLRAPPTLFSWCAAPRRAR